MHYVFSSKSIHKFKFCPYCGKDIMQVYDGDFSGMVQCSDCEECDNELEFDILEERLKRYPNWIDMFK